MDGVVERIGVFALVGVGSGFVSGLFGIGGGIVRIPLFVYLLPLFGVAHSVMMHVAVGTSMALVLPSAIASTRKQLALGNLDLSFFRTWAVGILIGVLIGTALLPYASTELLQVIFALFMVTVGIYEGFLKDRLVIARAAARRGKAGCGVGDRLPGRVDRHRRWHARDAGPAGLQHEYGGRDRDLVGNRTGDRRRRHDRSRRGRLACSWPARLLLGLCRPRDFRGDDADDHDCRPAGRALRPYVERDLAAADIHRAVVRDRGRPDPQAGHVELRRVAQTRSPGLVYDVQNILSSSVQPKR
jgi:uncharacterized membrane protein